MSQSGTSAQSEPPKPLTAPPLDAAVAELHHPVLLDRCVELLAPALSQPGAVMVDCTLGLGGHSEAVLERIPTATVIGIDRDVQAIELASQRLSRFGARFQPVNAVYDELPQVLSSKGIESVQGILADLGVSSLQIDSPERGFAYSQDAPLDMRMSQDSGITAAELLDTATEADLTRLLYRYGEEPLAPRIARAIVARRQAEPITRTADLADIIASAIPAGVRNRPKNSRVRGGHPAKRTFQALRIAVNDELGALERFLPAAINALAVGGRLVIESYQSLEDRLVKRAIAAGSTSSAPVGLPVELDEHQPYLRALTKGAERADAAETERNPRAASVRLRAVERIRAHQIGSKGD